jgi:hypothetical protein
MCSEAYFTIFLFYFNIVVVLANAFSASVVAACATAFASSGVAPCAIAASLALLANIATTPSLCTRSAYAARLASSTMCVAASYASIYISASRFAFLYMC